MNVPDLVYEGEICDYWESPAEKLYNIRGSFSIDPPWDFDTVEEILEEFQTLIETSSCGFSLDCSGSGDEKGWTSGFCPCNHLDDIKTLKEAKKEVLEFTTQLKDFIKAKGISCGEVKIKTEKE